MDLKKTAYLCSGKYASRSVLASREWAGGAAQRGECIISGFQSELERNVLEILLRTKAPIIMVLARCIYPNCPNAFKEAVEEGRMLICSQFEDDNSAVTFERAYKRNKLVIEYADKIVIGHVSKGGMIDSLLKRTDKPYTILDKITANL